MLLDAKLLFCQDFDLDAISASSNANMTSVLDMGAGKDSWKAALLVPGIGFSGLEWNVMCEGEAFASAGSPAITIDLHASAAAAMSSPVTLLSFGCVKGDGTIGKLMFSGKVPKVPADLRYFAVNVATTTALTAGQITSWLGGPDGDGVI